ncbi:MAG: glycosyltransferase [Victivallaceae bacterium]|nr:glycosyltransferase [Victivallaceae bacterium]
MTPCFYPRYGRNGASSRHRFHDFAERWTASGAEVECRPFFSGRYLERFYAGKGKSAAGLAAGWLRRLSAMLSMPDTPVIEYELLPFFPAWFELMFLRRRRFFLNFDDDVEVKYARIPWLRRKYGRRAARAAGVICANRTLLEKFAAVNSNTLLLPTPLDLAPFRTPPPEKFERFTVVWIGTPASYGYLLDAADKLRAMAQKTDFELLVIAKASLPPVPGVRCRMTDWSEKNEADLLRRSHVGIMPLPENDRFAAGKSAFKLIQYMAAGLPAIASDVGENRHVLSDGETGFLAGDSADWADKLAKLAASPELCRSMSAAALAAADEYSVESAFEKFRDFIAATR